MTDLSKSDQPSFMRGRSSKNQPLDTGIPKTYLTELLRPAPSTHGTLDSTKDGDTVKMADGSSVRLIGINAPEVGKEFKGTTDQPFSQQAKARLQELLAEGELTMQPGRSSTDNYNRTLAHMMTSDGRNVQEILLQEGLASTMSIEPNTRLSAFYKNLEQTAKDNKVGMWADPIPKREIGEFANLPPNPEGYIPSFQRTVGDRSQVEPTAPTPVLDDMMNTIQDDGLAANLYNWVEDLAQPKADEQDHIDIQQALPGILETRKLTPQAGRTITDQAKNVKHAELLADRIKRIQDRAPGREAMSLGASAVSGIGGFLGDPTNLIPGILVFKSGRAFAKTMPKLRKALTTAMPTLTGKTATFSAFAITEEALRTAPRLASDPTYDFDDYLINVGAAGAFGAGIARAAPTARFIGNTVIAPAYRTVNKVISNSFQGVKESLKVRTAINMVKDTAKFHPRGKANTAVRETLDTVDSNSVVRNARNKAKEQVATSVATRILKNTVSSLSQKLNKPDIDLADPTIMTSLASSLKDVVETGLGTKVKGKTDIDFNVTVEKATDKATDVEKPAATFKDVMQDIQSIRNKAHTVLKDTTGEIADKARAAIDANILSAERAVEAAAARQGVKILRKTAAREVIHTKIAERIDTALLPNKAAQFSILVNKLTTPSQQLDINKTLNEIAKVLGTKGETTSTAIRKWILQHDSQITIRATQAREQTTVQFNRLRDDLEYEYVGNPKDSDYSAAKKIIDDTQEELESLFDWIGMANTKQFSDLVGLDPRWAITSDEFESAIPATDMKAIEKAYDSLAQRWNSHQFGTLTQSLSAKLFRTKVPLARMMAMNILELPAGVAGHAERHETAAILAEMNFSRIVYPLNVAWRDLMEEAAQDMGLGIVAKAKMQNFNPNTPGIQQDIAREVMKAVNAAEMGKSVPSKPYITKFRQKLAEANDKLYDLQRDNGIAGITGTNRKKHYLRQSWHDGAILDMIDNTNVGRSGVIELFSKSLLSRGAGKLTKTEADDLAKTLIDLKLEAMDKPQVDAFTIRSENLSNSMSSIENVVKRLAKNGRTDSIENILKWVNEPVGGVAGYVHKRHINLDYTTTITKNGQTVSILDLLDNDVIGQVNRYGKEASGRSALSEATGGRLNSEQSMDDFINAMQQQAHDLGTHVNTKDVRNVFRQMMGLPYDGQLPMDWRKIRDAVSLAGMNGLGESQLAEFGLATNRGLSGLFAMNQLASKTVGRAKQWAGLKLSDTQITNKDFLDELQEYSRLYEDMHIVARQNVHFDGREATKSTGFLSKVVDTGTGGKYRPLLQYLQTRYTGYGAIRTMEEQVAMAGLLQDALKQVKSGNSFTSLERFKDLGLNLKTLKKYLDNGTITLREDGNIETLNLHRWSKKDSQSLGVALQRHAGQQVQKGFAGEASPLMTNPQIAFMMQFKSYPMLAAEKQMGRSMMFHDKEAGMGIALNAASSSAARMVRYYSMALALPADKREAYLERKFSNDFMHDTAAYMGIVGMMVNNTDMANDLIFGNETSVGDQLPALNWADNYLEAAKSANPLDEDGFTERDAANIQRGAPLGTTLWLNGIFGIIRNLMETDKDDRYQENTNLQRN